MRTAAPTRRLEPQTKAASEVQDQTKELTPGGLRGCPPRWSPHHQREVAHEQMQNLDFIEIDKLLADADDAKQHRSGNPIRASPGCGAGRFPGAARGQPALMDADERGWGAKLSGRACLGSRRQGGAASFWKGRWLGGERQRSEAQKLSAPEWAGPCVIHAPGETARGLPSLFVPGLAGLGHRPGHNIAPRWDSSHGRQRDTVTR